MLEWQKTGQEPRPKYRLSVKGRHVLGMAGIWGPLARLKDGAMGELLRGRHVGSQPSSRYP
jgi:hypothetical protein